MDISELLAFSVKNKASDLHLSAGLPPMIRVHGDVRRINLPPLEHKDVHGMIYDIMNDAQRKDYEENLECDFSFAIAGPRALPRQCVQPEPRRGRGVADDSVARCCRWKNCNARARFSTRSSDAAARAGAGDRPDRFRQVHHAGGDGQPHQRQRLRPHPHDRRPDRVRARDQEMPDQPARGRAAHPVVSPTRCARRCGKTRTSSWSARCATWRPSAWR